MDAVVGGGMWQQRDEIPCGIERGREKENISRAPMPSHTRGAYFAPPSE